MGHYKTEQEAFWAGDFGHEYVKRNAGCDIVAGNLALFSKIIRAAGKVASVMEFGANIGMNLIALRQLLPSAELAGVEINATAAAQLKGLGYVDVHEASILEFAPQKQYDMAFTKGVLIHINPEALPQVYDLLYKSSRKYILVAEYYNPAPVEINYRGHAGKLFKRDFAGEIMARFPDLTLVDYGFSYHKDPCFPQDDITWFLMAHK
jgi:spore coat polysaccharide biosynthesis protein SpsF